MNPEIDPEIGEDNIRIDEGVDEGYEIRPVTLMDNGIIVFDPIEFNDKYNCDALRYEDGVTYILDKDTKRWNALDDYGKPAGKLTPIK